MYAEVSSFQGVGIEESHCIVCRGVLISGVGIEMAPLYTEVSSFQGGWNRGVPLYCIQRCPHFRGAGIEMAPLYTEVSSFQEVGIEELHCIQRCPHFRGG